VARNDYDPCAASNGQTGERLVVDWLAPDRMRHLPALLDALSAKGFTLVVLDTAGVDDATTHQVIAAVDLCLMPARPTRLDIEASRRTNVRPRFEVHGRSKPPKG
jgi:chromosome partitioning protein